MIPIERFRSHLVHEFELESDDLDRGASFVGDLGFDSFELFRLMIFVEALLPGAELPKTTDPSELTVGAVYDFCAAEAAKRQLDLA